MARINLLPWREELKQQKQQEYLTVLAVVAIVAALVMMAFSSLVSSQIEHQNHKNSYLKQEISVLDAKIKELNELKQQKQDLQKRLDLIQELQRSRNLLTQVFNSMAEVIPAGVYLTSVEHKGRSIEFKGKSESNTRLAALVRRIDEIRWLTKPAMQTIVADKDRPKLLNEFVMTVEVADSESLVQQEQPQQGPQPAARQE